MGPKITRTDRGKKNRYTHSDPIYCIAAQVPAISAPGLSTQKFRHKNNGSRNEHTGNLTNSGWHRLHLQRTEVGRNVCQNVTNLSSKVWCSIDDVVMQHRGTWSQKTPIGSGKHWRGAHERNLTLGANPYCYAINIFIDYMQLNYTMTTYLMSVTTYTSNSTDSEVEWTEFILCASVFPVRKTCFLEERHNEGSKATVNMQTNIMLCS